MQQINQCSLTLWLSCRRNNEVYTTCIQRTKNQQNKTFYELRKPHLTYDIPVAISQPPQKWKLDGLGYAQNETWHDYKFKPSFVTVLAWEDSIIAREDDPHCSMMLLQVQQRKTLKSLMNVKEKADLPFFDKQFLSC